MALNYPSFATPYQLPEYGQPDMSALVAALQQNQGANPNVPRGPESGYEADYSAVEYQKALAKALQDKAGKSLETNRMAGGYVIPISPLEGLAKLGQGYFAGQAEKNALGAEKTYKTALGAALSKASSATTLQGIVDSAQGLPDLQNTLGMLGVESNIKRLTSPQMRPMSAAEISAAGLPAGTAAQRDPTTGKIDVLDKAEKPPTSVEEYNYGLTNPGYVARQDKLKTEGAPRYVITPDANSPSGVSYQPARPGLAAVAPANAAPPEMNPEESARLGGAAATGAPLNQIVPGYGRQAVAKRELVRNAGLDAIQAEHPEMNPAQVGEEYANRQIDYLAGKKSTSQLTTQLGSVRPAIAQLDFNIKKTTEEMAKLGSTDTSPILNAVARGEQKWTGNPAYSSLFYYMSGAAIEAAKIRSGGTASVAQLHQGAMDEAKNWASVNMTPAAWQAVATAMKAEGENVVGNYEQALQKQRINHTNATSPAPAGAPSADPISAAKAELARRRAGKKP